MGELDSAAKALADRTFEPRGYIHEWHLYLAQRRPEVHRSGRPTDEATGPS